MQQILNNYDLANMSFGYLTGADLMAWCSPQLLIKQYEVNMTSLQQGCTLAYGEIIRALLSRYAIADEFSKVSGGRDILCVKIASIMAIRNIMGNMAGISELMVMNFTWAAKELLAIRNGQVNLILPQANVKSISESFLVPQNFSTLG